MREPGAIPDSSYNRVLFKPIHFWGDSPLVTWVISLKGEF